ncbi:MAG TPA: hypothetical protein VEB43_12030 [Anaeromyxobacter sp.]|nr:hypothetical protein [Anaeromyxobacter sp.]
MPSLAAHLPASGTARAGASPLFLFAGAAILLLHALAPASLPVHLRMLGAVPGAIACLLWWRYFASRDFERLPFLEYAVTQVYLYWGLGTVTASEEQLAAAGPRGWAGAAAAACVVTAGFLLAAPLGRRLGVLGAIPLERCLPGTAPRLSAVVILPWLALTAAVQADAFAGKVPGSLYFVVQTVGGYSPLLAALAWRDLRAGRRSPWLVGCTVALSIAGLLTGMLEAAVQPVLMAITLQVVLRRRVPWRLLAAGALVIVIVNPAKHHYREAAWEDAVTREERAARDPRVAAERWWKALRAAWLPGQPATAQHTSGLASRLNELAINAEVIDRVPAAIPYDRGWAWQFIPVSIIPRFLYPGKPDFTDVFNDRFAITFAIQTKLETETSTSAFPLVADGYWNLGWPGVVIVALATGMVIGLFIGLFRARTWATTAVATSTFAALHANSAFGVQVIGILQHVLGLAFVLWVTWAIAAVVAAARPGRRPPDGAGSFA